MTTEKRCFSQFFDVKNPMKVRVTAPRFGRDGRREPPVRTDSRGATLGAMQLRLLRAGNARWTARFGARLGRHGQAQLAASGWATSRGILLGLMRLLVEQAFRHGQSGASAHGGLSVQPKAERTGRNLEGAQSPWMDRMRRVGNGGCALRTRQRSKAL